MLPKVKESQAKVNRASNRTKTLYEKKDAMSTRLHSKADFDRVRKEIKDSEQKDYKDYWVNEHVSEMERAHRRGNYRKYSR